MSYYVYFMFAILKHPNLREDYQICLFLLCVCVNKHGRHIVIGVFKMAIIIIDIIICIYIRIQLGLQHMRVMFSLIRKGSSQLSLAESIKTWSNQNLVSSPWSVLLFCTHWHCLGPSLSKGTFTNHHHPGLPALCSQDHLSCADTDCDIAHELKRQPMRGLHSCPGRCLISPIYPTNSPCFPFLSLFLTRPPFSCCQVPLSSLNSGEWVV